MAGQFLETLFTPQVLAAQKRYHGRMMRIPPHPRRDLLTDEEIALIGNCDSFYMATVTSNGWPYIQHRGGNAGFLKIVGENRLAFADYRGNRQMLTAGNLAGNNRAALFLMDYPRRARLKILGRARVEDAREHPDLAAKIAEPEALAIVERLFFIEVVSFDWNCPKHITPRFTSTEVEEAVRPLRERIAELETKLKLK